jgi:methionyl-tRNA synthetase
MTAPHTYITTTIPYVNARPHIGFALELVQADVLARYHRGRGENVRFQARDLIGAALKEFDFRQATAAVWAIADEANRFVNRVRPWQLAKAEQDGADGRLDAALRALLDACQILGRELSPFLPHAAARITAQCTPDGDGRLPPPSPVFRRLAARPVAVLL